MAGTPHDVPPLCTAWPRPAQCIVGILWAMLPTTLLLGKHNVCVGRGVGDGGRGTGGG